MSSPTQIYTKETWTREDNFQSSFLTPGEDVLDFAVQNSIQNGLPQIAVSPAQGKFLYLIAKSIGAKRILEVGTLGGYSAIWLARALPDDGELLTLELEPKHAKVARENLNRAGADVSGRVNIIVGSATDTLAKLKPEPRPFDLVFIDADGGFLTYYKEAKRLVKSGGVIMIDNMVRRGGPSDPENTDPINANIRELLKLIKDDKEVEATTLSTVGVKGYDGFMYLLRK